MANLAILGLAVLFRSIYPGYLGLLVIGLAGNALWIWALVDCVRKETDTGNTKLIWILIIAILNIIGAILYFGVRRPERKTELGR
jgi:hypothetical protein